MLLVGGLHEQMLVIIHHRRSIEMRETSMLLFVLSVYLAYFSSWVHSLLPVIEYCSHINFKVHCLCRSLQGDPQISGTNSKYSLKFQFIVQTFVCFQFIWNYNFHSYTKRSN